MVYLAFASRAVVVAVFLAAALSKVRSRSAWRLFQSSTAVLTRTHPRFASRIGVLVVAAEFAVATLVAIQPVALLGFTLAVLMLLAFSAAVGLAIRDGTRVHCQCFGSGGTLQLATLVRNACLLGIVMYAFASDLRGVAVVPADPSAIALTTLIMIAASTFVIYFVDIVSVFKEQVFSRR